MAQRRGRARRAPVEPGHYPRTARVNELCREILAEDLGRIDDERLELVTITHVEVDPDMRRARVEFSRLGEGEEEAAQALGEHRVPLQRSIARQTRLRRTPELYFRIDQSIRAGARIEQLLRETPPPSEGSGG